MGSREALRVTVSRMTEAIVVQLLWADLRHGCISGTGGGVRKLVSLLEKQQAEPKWTCCNKSCINNLLQYEKPTRLTSSVLKESSNVFP